MNLFNTKAPITITCQNRLSSYLAKEVEELGFCVDKVFPTGLSLEGNLNDCIKLNLNLCCASQALYQLKEFEANDPDALYANLIDFPWEKILPGNGYFSITSNVNTPSINNSMYANLRVKDAIVDRIREKNGKRPLTGAALLGAVIHLYWKNKEACVFIDSSGNSLGRHGYRKIPGAAPMLEALASAAIYATGWDKASPFVNPMCGSGTLAIEAAMMATKRKPGLFRSNYAFMHLKGYEEKIYQREREQLERQIISRPGLRIIATDHSKPAIENAKKNAVAAGVFDLIQFSICDFAETPVPKGLEGIVFLNPEYGERLGNPDRLEDTYKRIGDFLKKECGGYLGYVFTGNLELAKKIGLKAKRRIEFFTSVIDCRLLEYELYSGTRTGKTHTD